MAPLIALLAAERSFANFSRTNGSSGIGASKRALNENVAMLSDLFIFAALAAFVLADAISR